MLNTVESSANARVAAALNPMCMSISRLIQSFSALQNVSNSLIFDHNDGVKNDFGIDNIDQLIGN